MKPDAAPKKRFRSRATHQDRKERQRLKQQGAESGAKLGPSDAAFSSAMSASDEYRSRLPDINAMLNLRPASYQRKAQSSLQYNTILDLLAKKAQGRYVSRELRDAEKNFWLAHGGDLPFPENPNGPRNSVQLPFQTPANFKSVRRAQALLSEQVDQVDLGKSSSSITKALKHNGHQSESANLSPISLKGGRKFDLEAAHSRTSSVDSWGQDPAVSQVDGEKNTNDVVEKAVPKESGLEDTLGTEVTNQDILTCALSAVILGVMDTVIERAGFKVPRELIDMKQDSKAAIDRLVVVNKSSLKVQQGFPLEEESVHHVAVVDEAKEVEVRATQERKNSKASKRAKNSLSEFIPGQTSQPTPRMNIAKSGQQSAKHNSVEHRGPSQRFADLRGPSTLVPSNVIKSKENAQVSKPASNSGWTTMSSSAPLEIVQPVGRPRSHVLNTTSPNYLNASSPLTVKLPEAVIGIAAWKSLPSRIAADDQAALLASKSAVQIPNAKAPVFRETYKQVVISEGDYSRKIAGKSVRVIE